MNNIYSGDIVESNRIIYTPSDFTKQNLTYLQEIGTSKSKKPHVSQRVGLNSMLFFVVVSGSGHLTYDHTEYNLETGDCVFINCNKPYAHTSSDSLWAIRWIHFYSNTASALYAFYQEQDGRAVIHPLDSAPFIDLWERLFQAARSTEASRDIKIHAELSQLWSMVDSASRHSNPNALSSQKAEPSSRFQMELVREYLEKKYPEKISLDTLAEEFYINKYYLTRVYKEKYNETINETLQRIRITHAKELLRFSNLSVEAVGEECGLGALNYFSRTFKKVEGMNPTEYRKLW